MKPTNALVVERLKRDPLVLSGYLWCVPAMIALYEHHVVLVATAIIMGFSSTMYHVTLEKDWEILDTIAAVLYIAVGPYLLTEITFGPFTIVFLPGFFESLAIAAIAFVFYGISRIYDRPGSEGSYVFVHSVWHIAAVGVSTSVYGSYFSWFFQL